jgi:CspA family cold shock protein
MKAKNVTGPGGKPVAGPLNKQSTSAPLIQQPSFASPYSYAPYSQMGSRLPVTPAVSAVSVPSTPLMPHTPSHPQLPASTTPQQITPGTKTGKVKWFDTKKGYGFVIPASGGKDVFVHQSSLQAYSQDGRVLQEGQQIEFTYENEGGQIRAGNVTLPGGVMLDANKYGGGSSTAYTAVNPYAQAPSASGHLGKRKGWESEQTMQYKVPRTNAYSQPAVQQTQASAAYGMPAYSQPSAASSASYQNMGAMSATPSQQAYGMQQSQASYQQQTGYY